jgi:hypothetical protein
MNIIMRNKNILYLALGVGLILLVPWIAMQLTGEMVWSLFDFVFAGALLFGTGLAFELISRKTGTLEYRAAVGAALAGAFLLVWINLAVGIIGSEDNPANVMYLGVLAVLVIGALLALLRPRGMALALFATALAHAVVTLIALVITPWDLDAFKTLALNGFFVALWVASAVLFRRANATLNRQLA